MKKIIVISLMLLVSFSTFAEENEVGKFDGHLQTIGLGAAGTTVGMTAAVVAQGIKTGAIVLKVGTNAAMYTGLGLYVAGAAAAGAGSYLLTSELLEVFDEDRAVIGWVADRMYDVDALFTGRDAIQE